MKQKQLKIKRYTVKEQVNHGQVEHITTAILIQIIKDLQNHVQLQDEHVVYSSFFLIIMMMIFKKILIDTNNDNLPSDEVSQQWDDWNLTKQKKSQ